MGLLTECLPSSLPRCGEVVKLLHQAEPIRVVPLFYDLAVYNTIDIYIGNGCFLLHRGEPPKRVLGFEPDGLAVYHQVALRNQ
jgi:hypothetical protein